MKNIYLRILFSLFIIGAITSCEDSDLAIDELYDNVNTQGAFIRTLSSPLQLVNLSSETMNFIAMSLEVQEGNGSIPSTLRELNVYAALYNDQDQIEPTVDASGNPFPEVLLSSIQAADFVPSELNNLPSTDVYIPTQTIVDNADGAVFTIPTFIYLRLELVMEDGTTYTDTNVGPDIAALNNFYNTPFSFNIIFLPS